MRNGRLCAVHARRRTHKTRGQGQSGACRLHAPLARLITRAIRPLFSCFPFSKLPDPICERRRRREAINPAARCFLPGCSLSPHDDRPRATSYALPWKSAKPCAAAHPPTTLACNPERAQGVRVGASSTFPLARAPVAASAFFHTSRLERCTLNMNVARTNFFMHN